VSSGNVDQSRDLHVADSTAVRLISSAATPTGTASSDLPEWLRELYPFRTRTLAAGSQTMSFVDEGPAEAPAAPVFVLLHGNPTWSFLYRNLIQRLRSKYRVLAPDHVGFGLSSKPGSPAYHTLDQHIANFTRWVEALDLRQVTLVMNGWGGPIGLGYAVAHPENVARLVLANALTGQAPLSRRMRLPLGLRVARAGRIGAWLDSLLNLSMHSIFASRMHRRLADLPFEGYCYPFRDQASRHAVSAFMEMYLRPDRNTSERLAEIFARLKNVTAPADIVWGARDPLLTKLHAYLLRDQLPNAREPIFVADASHYLPEEASDTLAEVVLRGAERAGGGESLFKILT
jgi:haloalkane dehalogenase